MVFEVLVAPIQEPKPGRSCAGARSGTGASRVRDPRARAAGIRRWSNVVGRRRGIGTDIRRRDSCENPWRESSSTRREGCSRSRVRRTPGATSAPRIRTRQEIRRQRRPRRHQCWNHLIVAPLWPKHGVNLGTLLRTLDGVAYVWPYHGCPGYPKRSIREIRCGRAHASTGSTATSAGGWGASQPKTQILGVELTDESIRLADLPAARTRTDVVLGNEKVTEYHQKPWTCSTSRRNSDDW